MMGREWNAKTLAIVALVSGQAPLSARSEVLEIRCSTPFVEATGNIITHIYVDTQSKYVRQTTSFAKSKRPSLTLEYRDGVVGKTIAEGPNVRQFVRINDE